MEAGGSSRVGDLELDAGTMLLRIGADVEVRLTRLETRLLQLLLAQAGRPVATDRLLQHVWGHKGGGDRQLLKQLVHRLRQRIGDDSETPRWIETLPGVGYRVRAPAAQPEPGPE